MKIFETFTGIGAQHKALTNLQKQNLIKEFEIVGTSEWYISAIIAYSLIHHKEKFLKFYKNNLQYNKEYFLEELNKHTYSTDSKNPSNLLRIKEDILRKLYTANYINKNFGSILEVKGNILPKNIDVLTYSFPCIDLSNAGLKKGLFNGNKSGLLWEIGRIISEIKLNNRPKILLMENVPTLFNKFKDGWEKWKNILDKYGYNTYQVILNSSDFNSAQIRRRAFAISIKKDIKINNNFNLEKEILKTKVYINYKKEKNKIIKDIIDKKVDNKYYINKPYNILKSTDGKSGAKFDLIDHSLYEMANRIYDINYKSPTLTTSGKIKIWDKSKIREITEIESFQLMGFTKEDYLNIDEYFTKGHKYRFSGNSIVVNVLESLFEIINNILKTKK